MGSAFRALPRTCAVVLAASLLSLALGLTVAFLVYRNREKDPISIPAFRDRLYFDRFYDNILVRFFQDAPAAIVHFFDEFLINGVLVGGLSRAAESLGNIFRKVQSGSLQGYAFACGLGAILVVYFTVFY